jgi:hypothetical protein
MTAEQLAPVLAAAARHDWVVYAKPPFGGPHQVLRYLARYTHRIAISEHRLLSVNDESVTFAWKDYRDGGATKQMKLPGPIFLRRFLQHVLPRSYTRLRAFGFLANSGKAKKLAAIRALLDVEPPPPVAKASSHIARCSSPGACCPGATHRSPRPQRNSPARRRRGEGVAVVAVDHGIDSPGANDVEAANEDAEDDDAEALAGEARDRKSIARGTAVSSNVLPSRQARAEADSR